MILIFLTSVEKKGLFLVWYIYAPEWYDAFISALTHYQQQHKTEGLSLTFSANVGA